MSHFQKTSLILFLLSIPISAIFAQINVDSFLIGDKELPQVLLVGTFHMIYWDQDAYKTAPENRLDVLDEARQKEMQELVDYIARFRPNKIFVEDFNKDNILMNNYRAYRKGDYQLTADEIDQIVYRLMERLELDTVYGVDERTIRLDLMENENTKEYVTNLSKEIDKAFKDSEIGKKYFEMYEIEDKYLLRAPLLEYFKFLNSAEYQRRGLYTLFAGIVDTGGTQAADLISIGQVSRNIRILQHISRNITSPDDRVLILFGSSHTEFFKIFFDSSPVHNLINFEELEYLEVK